MISTLIEIIKSEIDVYAGSIWIIRSKKKGK